MIGNRRILSAILLSTGMCAVWTAPAMADSVPVAERFEMQVQLEDHYENKLSWAFEEMGVKTVILVSAQMDWSRTQRTAKRVEQGSTISFLTTSSESRPADGPRLYESENVPKGPESVAITAETEDIENFQPSEFVTAKTLPPGVVKQFSVAVFVLGPIGQERIQQYQHFIHLAVGSGLKPTEVAVFGHPFPKEQGPAKRPRKR